MLVFLHSSSVLQWRIFVPTVYSEQMPEGRLIRISIGVFT